RIAPQRAVVAAIGRNPVHIRPGSIQNSARSPGNVGRGKREIYGLWRISRDGAFGESVGSRADQERSAIERPMGRAGINARHHASGSGSQVVQVHLGLAAGHSNKQDELPVGRNSRTPPRRDYSAFWGVDRKRYRPRRRRLLLTQQSNAERDGGEGA